MDDDQLVKVWRELDQSKTFLVLGKNALTRLRKELIINTNSKSPNAALHKLEEPMLYDWLNGKYKIPLVKFRKLANVANMNCGDLLLRPKVTKPIQKYSYSTGTSVNGGFL